MSLIRQSMESEELVWRTRADVIERMQDYWVLEIDGKLMAAWRSMSSGRCRRTRLSLRPQ